MQENIFIESSTNDKRDGGMAYVFCSSVINNSFGKSVNLIVILLHSFVTEKNMRRIVSPFGNSVAYQPKSKS